MVSPQTFRLIAYNKRRGVVVGGDGWGTASAPKSPVLSKPTLSKKPCLSGENVKNCQELPDKREEFSARDQQCRRQRRESSVTVRSVGRPDLTVVNLPVRPFRIRGARLFS